MHHQIKSVEPTKVVSHSRLRLNYQPKINFPNMIFGTSSEKDTALQRIRTNHAEAIEALRAAESRNKEPESDEPKQNYYCIGCDIPEGTLRAQVLGLAAYPLLQAAMAKILGEKLTLQCYFPQTYEEASGIGPGGIIGTVDADSDVIPDISARRAHAYSGWVGDGLPIVYREEKEAKAELWRETFRTASKAKFWLMQQGAVPPEGLPFPQELLDEMHMLLGPDALRPIVANKLGRNWVLLNPHRVTLAENLHWALAA